MPPSDDELKKAFKAFKKRLKLTRLDEDSRLGHGPMSSGGKSQVVAIQPPSDFAPEVWEALVQRGFLKREGVGFYTVVPGK
jgi:hypothetical protein